MPVVGANAQRLVAGQAIAAVATERARIKHGLLADRQAAGRVGLGHHTGAFHAQHQRQVMGDAGTVVAHVQVDAIQAGRMDAQQRFAGFGYRARVRLNGEAGAATGLQDGGFHGGTPVKFRGCRLGAITRNTSHSSSDT